jgi:putative ATPase
VRGSRRAGQRALFEPGQLGAQPAQGAAQALAQGGHGGGAFEAALLGPELGLEIGHYNLISALHKAVRGSDPDAALYWLCRMLDGGEDRLFLARRLVRMAVEDIGLADPQAITQALAAKDTYDFLGSPEGELALAQAAIYLATAPKSNAAYVAYKGAMRAAKEHGSLSPPKHILNAPTKLMAEQGYGSGYEYDHNAEEGFSGQNYFPDEMRREQFYDPPERGFEREVRKRLAYWAARRDKRQQEE